LPNNKLNTRYNGQCFENKRCAASGRQTQQNNHEMHMMASSSDSRQERLGGRMDPSLGSNAQLTIQKDTFSSEKTRNALFMK